MSRGVLIVVVAALVATSVGGCRLDDAGAPSPGSGTPSIDVGIDIGSSTDAGAGPDAAPDTARSARCIVATTTDFRAAGGVSVIDADTLQVGRDLTAVHPDAYVRVHDERVFVINRQGADNVQELDPSRGFATAWQYSVGSGTNPWDLAMMPDGTAWVPLYNEGAVLHVDPDALDASLFVVGDPMPLPTWTDDDARVEPLAAFPYDDRLHVLVQGLDDYPYCADGSRGYLHIVDDGAPSDSMESMALAACNPVAYDWLDEHRLLVGYAGSYRSLDGGADVSDDGGLEVVDLASGTLSGLLATETDWDGRDIVQLTVGADDRLWLALADANFGVAVRRADFVDGELILGDEVWRSETGGIFDIIERFGRLWIADRTPGESGVMVLDAETGAPLVDAPLDTGFAPFDLAALDMSDGNCLPR